MNVLEGREDNCEIRNQDTEGPEIGTLPCGLHNARYGLGGQVIFTSVEVCTDTTLQR